MSKPKWAVALNNEAIRRTNRHPALPVVDDSGRDAGLSRVGRRLRKLPGETRAQAADRQITNAKDDVWFAANPTTVAELLVDDSFSPAARIGNAAFGALYDEGKTFVKLGAAAARTVASLYHETIDSLSSKK